MIYNFKKTPLTDPIQYKAAIEIERLKFQENVVIAMVTALIGHDPKYLDDFGVNKARKIWEASAYLSEERNYRIPKRTI